MASAHAASGWRTPDAPFQKKNNSVLASCREKYLPPGFKAVALWHGKRGEGGKGLDGKGIAMSNP